MISRNELLSAAAKLKPLPESAVRLAHLVAEDCPDMQEISRVVEFDPVLTGTVIRVANSAACGGRLEVGSVQEAVSRLGTSAILALAVRAAVRASFESPMPEYGLGEGEFWSHSSCASLAAEHLRKFCGASIPSDAATAALVHDIGKLVLAKFLSGRRLSLLQQVMSEGDLLWVEAEREVLGIDHAELGGLIVAGWKVPETIRVGVAFHHSPDEGSHVMCDGVHVANLVATAALVENAGDILPPYVRAGVLKRLKMTTAQVSELTIQVHESFKELEESYSGTTSAV